MSLADNPLLPPVADAGLRNNDDMAVQTCKWEKAERARERVRPSQCRVQASRD